MNKRNPANREGGLTNCKRFAFGLDTAYWITFPLGIHSVRMRKQCKFADTETPSKGKTFGCDKCFQAMISRQNHWGKLSNGDAHS